MEINKKNRTELKAFFQANNIPTQQHFEQFIDAGLNQAEDGIAKIQGSPVALQAEGGAVGTQEILNLFSDFAEDIPGWSVNLNPRVDPQEPGSNHPGFNIKDATGQSRLFIRSGDGSIGVGTIEPEARLTVQGTDNGSLIAAVSDTEQHSRIFEVSQEAGSGRLSLRSGDTTEVTRLSGATENPSFFLGKVGIGTAEPERSLHVRGDIIRLERDVNSPSLQIIRYDSDYQNIWKVFNLSTVGSGVNNGKFIISDRGVTTNGAGAIPRLTIDNTGNVGIGTESPSEKLEVGGNMLVTSDGQTELKIVSTSSSSTSWRTRLYMDRGSDFRSGGVWIDATADDEPIWFSGVPYTGNGYQIGYHASEPEYKDHAKLFINENGNVGIGTASPGAKLEVGGDLKVTGDMAAGNDLIVDGNIGIGTASPNTKLEVVGGPIRAGGTLATSQAEYTEIGHSGSHGYISTTGDGNLDFRHDENTKMSITSGGNVGIGITSPADQLDVRGKLRLSTSNNHARMYIGSVSGRGTGLVFEIKSSNHGSNRKIIWNGDSNWDSPSDERLKSNIRQEKNILERLVQLDVKSYNWKDTYDQKKAKPIIGFMAQEVKPLFPSLVGEVEDEDIKKKLMTLNYASFGVLAVGAIKELRAEKDAEITKHKQLIDELKTKVEKLEKQLV